MPILEKSFNLDKIIGIDGKVPLNYQQDTYSEEGNVWLKTGVIETNTGLYPDATASYNFNGVSNDITGTSEPEWADIVWVPSRGTYFITGTLNDNAYEVNPDGTTTGTIINFSNQDINPRGITWDGTHIWMCGNSNRALFKYDITTGYAGTSISTGMDVVDNVTWDGTYFWVSGVSAGVNAINQYDAVGTQISSTPILGRYSSSAWDGTYLWISIVYDTYGYMSQFDVATKDFTGVKFYTPRSENEAILLAWKEDKFAVMTREIATGTAYIQEYVYSVGTSVASFDSDTSYPFYIRVA